MHNFLIVLSFSRILRALANLHHRMIIYAKFMDVASYFSAVFNYPMNKKTNSLFSVIVYLAHFIQKSALNPLPIINFYGFVV